MVAGGKTDLPFYNGQPAALGLRAWLLVLAAVGLGFIALIRLPVPPIAAAVMFTGLPLLALRITAGRQWTALFAPYGIRQWGQSAGFGLLTLICSFIVGAILSRFLPLAPNPSTGMLATSFDLAMLLARSFIQLIGEELVTILPLLAVLWLCVEKLKLSRRAGLAIAIAASTLWFGAMHLETYNWNFAQCFGVIGTARLVLTASYLLTRNLFVCAGAHIINDWTLFFISFAGAHSPVGTGG